ncbi:MAG TPA: rhodanese-like domain-containing protein [Burkholderiales bacterium]|nr:rhodanese-like domain-containing protein [Burkholderiales bacterium]
MDETSEILNKADQRREEKGLPYAGALLPPEAYQLLRNVPGAFLVDVRTRPEWDYVGRVPDSVMIEWQSYPDGRPNPEFLERLQECVPKDAVVMFLCRSGTRSHAAATVAARAGYAKSFNVLQGFEGDKDAQGHRGTVGGWKVAGLPWTQG